MAHLVWKDNFGHGNNEPWACIGELPLLDKLEPPSLNRVEKLNNFICIVLRCKQFSNRMNVEALFVLGRHHTARRQFEYQFTWGSAAQVARAEEFSLSKLPTAALPTAKVGAVPGKWLMSRIQPSNASCSTCNGAGFVWRGRTMRHEIIGNHQGITTRQIYTSRLRDLCDARIPADISATGKLVTLKGSLEPSMDDIERSKDRPLVKHRSAPC